MKINSISIYNAIGHEFKVKIEHLNEHRYLLTFKDMPSGIYFLNLDSDAGNSIKKIIIE